MSNVLDTLKGIQSKLAERNDLQAQLQATQTELNSLLDNLQAARKDNLISLPFVYRDLLIRVDSVGTLILEKANVLEDPQNTTSDKPKEWQLWRDQDVNAPYMAYNTKARVTSFYEDSPIEAVRYFHNKELNFADYESDESWEANCKRNKLELLLECSTYEDLLKQAVLLTYE